MSATFTLPNADVQLSIPESPSYHSEDQAADEDIDPVAAVDTSAAAAIKAFRMTPPPVVETPTPAATSKQPKARPAVAQKQPKSAPPTPAAAAAAAAKKAVAEPAAKAPIAAQRKNQTPIAKRSAAAVEAKEAADPDATQSLDAAPKKRKPDAAPAQVAAPVEAKKKPKKAAETPAKPKKAAEAPKKRRKARIAFTPESRKPGKRASDDTRPRRPSAFIDDEAGADDDDEEEDDDYEGDDAEEEEEDDDEVDVVENEGGAVGLGEDEDDDDNATVAITKQQQHADDAKLMSSKRSKPRGDPDKAAARRIAAIEFDSEDSGDEAIAAAAAAAVVASKGKRKKAPADNASVATAEKNAAKSKRKTVVPDGAGGDDDAFDMDAVLLKNAKKFKLVSRNPDEPVTTVSVRKNVTRKSRDGTMVTTVYRLLQLDSTRRCAYSKAELMKPNPDNVPRIDMNNFLHFAAVVDNKYKMEEVLSFLVDKTGTMCACPHRDILKLLYLDHQRDFVQFRDFYDKLPEYIALNNSDKVPPVPPALYTTREIMNSKPSCPSASNLDKWTQAYVEGGVDAGDDSRSVVPATEYGGDADDIRSVVTTKRPKAGPSRRPPPPPLVPATAAVSFGVHTNVDFNNPVYRDLELVSRHYGPGTQLPLAPFVGNPMARLLLEFGPMCPTEQHAAYFAHLIRAQISMTGEIVDAMIREVNPPPVAAAAAAHPVAE